MVPLKATDEAIAVADDDLGISGGDDDDNDVSGDAHRRRSRVGLRAPHSNKEATQLMNQRDVAVVEQHIVKPEIKQQLSFHWNPLLSAPEAPSTLEELLLLATVVGALCIECRTFVLSAAPLKPTSEVVCRAFECMSSALTWVAL